MRDADATRLKRSTAPEDRARILVARVRDGDLSNERLLWAARLGDEAAKSAYGETDRSAINWASWWDRRHALRCAAEAVSGQHYKLFVVGFAADCAEHVLLKIPEDRRQSAIDVLAAVRTWIAEPTSANLEIVRRRRANLSWRYAANDAAEAAANAADAAADAADAADAANAGACGAYVAANAADADNAGADAAERDWQRRHLIELVLKGA